MTSPADLRRAHFLSQFDLATRTGLEIGPFDRPIFSRADFPNILYADVKDTAELRRLARASPTRTEADVVPVDFVLLDKQLDEVVPQQSLDFVFCAHVLEHVPDLVAVLNSVEAILRPGGLFLIVYPDRHYTYDIDRPATSLAQFRDRHTRRISRPDPETVEEHFLNHRKVMVGRLWQGLPDSKGPRVFTPEQARNRADTARTSYIDVHCNVLNAREFGNVIKALRDDGLTGFEIADIDPTRAPLNEFYVALKKPGAKAAVRPVNQLAERSRRILERTRRVLGRARRSLGLL
ncbi:bifunctional 2-polyprenyl-6-hydroxyphenol methylase/3-demethylubiquinol 3-O-methyltransferase UbiG [Puniceibacterium sp. IMCC21224]|uniref:class I SAM-dependent methyltransferase n=1 Tax=Puniceibacterium sp. IMCC21224 TaxID=1618204 RepID=UPI00064DC167|nr:methyltransferase domain-containing protein [Puniceibacterium sp. IMCC21224]KMK68805.1 Methyltransferase domain [Puniceibacterium sp. IMCC21224]